jgi:hypothetical protein
MLATFKCTPSEGLQPALVEEVGRRAQQQQFNSQQVSNIVWGLAILGVCTPATWQLLTDQYRSITASPESLPEEALTQVGWKLHTHQQRPGGQCAVQYFGTLLWDRCQCQCDTFGRNVGKQPEVWYSSFAAFVCVSMQLASAMELLTTQGEEVVGVLMARWLFGWICRMHSAVHVIANQLQW